MKVGDIVILRETSEYFTSGLNPNSMDVLGIIIEIDRTPSISANDIEVLWFDERHLQFPYINDYNEEDLITLKDARTQSRTASIS